MCEITRKSELHNELEVHDVDSDDEEAAMYEEVLAGEGGGDDGSDAERDELTAALDKALPSPVAAGIGTSFGGPAATKVGCSMLHVGSVRTRVDNVYGFKDGEQGESLVPPHARGCSLSLSPMVSALKKATI